MSNNYDLDDNQPYVNLINSHKDIYSKKSEIELDISKNILSVFKESDVECIVSNGYGGAKLYRFITKDYHNEIVTYAYKIEIGNLEKTEDGFVINNKFYFSVDYNKKYFPTL